MPAKPRPPYRARPPRSSGWTRRLLVVALLATTGLAAGASAAVETDKSAAFGQIEARTLNVAETGDSVRHLVFTPSTYADSGDRTWPLIVGLHGTAGRPQQVMAFQRLRELAERHGFLVVCPHSSGVGAVHRRYVMAVVADTERHFRVDPERIYLLGFSRGGAGVWGLAAEHPDRWAALAPIAPATPADPAPLLGLRHIPVVVVLGERDKAVSQRAVRRWVRRMDELGMEHRFIELPGVEHDLSKVNFLPLIFDFFSRATPPSGSALASER